MNRTVYVDGARVQLAPAALLGQGGEAEVYDLGDGRVLKWWKPPDHPDYDGLPDAQAAAARRLVERPAKLRALPGNLPAAVVAPCGFALASKRGANIVGYLMPKIAGEPLHSYGEPRWRRDHPTDGAQVVAALLSLHDAIASLHARGVVVGDCNDLNVLVDGTRVHLIDVDSYQLAGFPCTMYSERFVDPRLCDQAGVPVRPYDADSDWFAFAVMAFRSLLGVGPWGGVHKHCPTTQRASRRLSVYASDVVYPRAARPLAILPDELAAAFRAIFETDRRGAVLRTELERLRLRRCSTCSEEHGRVRCPACLTQAHLPPAVVHGRLRWHVIDSDSLRARPSTSTTPFSSGTRLGSSGAPPSTVGYEVTRTTPVWIDAGALWRHGKLGPERIGNVLAMQTRAWVGAKLGVGFYRAGGYAVGFVFRPDRGPLDDRVTLPKLRGKLVDAHAVLGDDRAWLVLTFDRETIVVVIAANGTVVASDTLADSPHPKGTGSPGGSLAWLGGIGGACAAGPHLFVPTDDGIARVEVVQGAIVPTRVFAETSPLVGAGDRLVISSGGIDVVRRRDAIRMQLT